MHRVLFLMAFLVGITLPVAFSWSQDQWKSMLPDGEGKDLTAELCGTMCHNLQKTVVSRKTPQEWEKTVNDMVARGAQIFPDEVVQIVKYLAKSFPPDKRAAQQ
jgi:hypothetical protein